MGKESKKTVDAVYEEKTTKTTKKEEVKKPEIVVESPIKSGLSEGTKGMIIGMVITALIALVIILLILGKNDNNNNKTTKLDPSSYSDAMKEFYEYFNSKELALIVFASSECSYCVAQEPIVENIDESYDIKYLYMDYLELGSEDEINKVVEELGLTSGSTPTSVVVKDGKVVKTWVGYVSGETYVEYLVSSGMLPKGSKYLQEENLTTIDYTKFKSLLKDSKTSAIVFDAANCTTTCSAERELLNKIAKDNNISIYHLSATAFSEAEQKEFVESLGGWGYDTEAYKEKQTVNIPLLMFVKNGKIIEFNVGYEKESEITTLFKKTGLTK